MKDSGFWKNHWQTSSLLESDNPFVQVGRTKHKTPVSLEDWAKTLSFIEERLRPSQDDVLIDLCCGNGLLSDYFSSLTGEVIAIDYSQQLLNSFVAKNSANIKLLQCDINALEFSQFSFNKVLFNFAAQHFSEAEILRILQRIQRSIASGGMIYIGEVPDLDRKWNFFSNKEYKSAYFNGLIKGEPIIGTWFEKDFFEYAAENLGFKEIEIFDQPEYMLNHNHRFDILIKN